MRAMASDRDLAQRAVRAGAGAAQRMAGGELDVRSKTSPADLVSAADHASEEAIVALLRAERPDDAIVGEEGASVGAGSRRWLVDGLDGTVNFLRAIPQWCVAVVLEEEGEPLATAVLDPERGELFSAARGEGAQRDGVTLHVRDGAPLREAVLSTFLRADKLRGTPPAASFGRLAAAAAVLRMLVQEAGGRTAVIDGDPLTWFVAAAPGTFEELVALVSATTSTVGPGPS
jgi:fructose-1,6-bisphosphatase/inositol monophosphatase family enzyme